MAAHGRVAET